jgi:hypothetical protein
MRLGVCWYEKIASHTATVVAGLVIGTHSTKPVLPAIDPGFTECARTISLGAWRQDFPEIVVPHCTLYTNTHRSTSSVLEFRSGPNNR